MRNLRTATTVTLLVMFAGTTACTTGNSENYTDHTKVTSQRVGKTTTAQTINLTWCTAKRHDDYTYYTRVVQFVNPATKSGSKAYFTHRPVVFESLADCHRGVSGEGRKLRSAFSENFSVMSAQLANKFTGQYHTGVIEGRNKPMTSVPFKDLSGLKDDDTINRQTQGAFGPDDQLYYVQQSRQDVPALHSVNPFKPSERREHSKHDAVLPMKPDDSSQSVFFLPGDEQPHRTASQSNKYDTEVRSVTSNDGNWQIGFTNDNQITYSGPSKLRSAKTSSALYPLAIDKHNKMKFIGWNGEDTIVRATINGDKVNTTTILSGDTSEGFKLYDVAVSPDGKSVAYIAAKSTNGPTNTGLYTMPINGSGEPQLIKDMTNIKGYDGRILGWE